jgi:hypothetical protein
LKALADNMEVSYTETGKQKLTFTLTQKQPIDDLKAVIANKKLLAIECKEYRKKRSLDANSYAWLLIGKIADVLRTSKEEIYIKMLTRYGQREKQLISIIAEEEALKMIYRAVDNHCCEVGESELNGKTFKHLAILIGSSQYDGRQMAILIDGIISEAKELDIETMTLNEIAELKSRWKGV